MPTPRNSGGDTAAVANANRDPNLERINESRQEVATRQEFAKLLATGNAQRDAKKFDEAEKSYRDASKLIADDGRPFYGLGNLYSDQARWAVAIDAYKQAVVRSPDDAGTRLALAAALLKSGEGPEQDRLAQAESQLWTAATLQSRDENIYDLMEIVFAKRGYGFSKLETSYRQILSFNPQSIGTSLRLSTLLWQSSRQSEATGLLAVAERIAVSASDTLKVAEVLEAQRQYDRADRLVSRVLKDYPAEPEAHLLRGLIMIDRKRYSAAVSGLKVAATATPGRFVPHYLLGIAYLGDGKLAEAEESFRTAATRIPQTGNASIALASWLAVLGDAYANSDRTADAIRLYELAQQHNSNDKIKSKLLEIRAAH